MSEDVWKLHEGVTCHDICGNSCDSEVWDRDRFDKDGKSVWRCNNGHEGSIYDVRREVEECLRSAGFRVSTNPTLPHETVH